MRLFAAAVFVPALLVLGLACGGTAFDSEPGGAGGATSSAAATGGVGGAASSTGGDPSTASSGGDPSGSSTSTSSSEEATSSSTGGADCMDPSDCPDPMNECVLVACKEGHCDYPPVAAGLPLAAQIPGNCREEVCDGSGGQATKVDDSDVGDDGNACTNDGCSGGVPTHEPTDAGKACAQGDGQVCDGAGACVQCLAVSDCPSDGLCIANICVDASCQDGVEDGSETATDCGGACSPCPDGKGCALGADCESGVCEGAVCQPPTCLDGVKNGAESDVDCGGDGCEKCPIGEGCAEDADCTTGSCEGGVCAASCSDGVKDGAESDVDCGGTCSACPDGRKCAHGYDCASHLCLLGVCAL